jgi:uncharacterized protein (TIGR02001 family)
MNKMNLRLMSFALLSVWALFSQPTVSFAEEAQTTVTGNMSLVGDYRFRGFTQTNYAPALQGGFDLEHVSGLYAGNWNSNVAQNLYNGSSLEMDLYAGYKGSIAAMYGTGYDVGAIYYYYPKSGVDSVSSFYANKAINNSEVYVGLSNGPLSLKVNYGISDYFRYAYLSGASLSTKGTTYFDLTYSQVFQGLIFGAHVGVLNLKNYNQNQFATSVDTGYAPLVQSVNDYKLSLGKDLGDNAVISASYYATSKRGYFQTDLTGIHAAGKPGLVLGFAKGF